MYRDYLMQFNFENNGSICVIETVIDPRSNQLTERLAIKNDSESNLEMAYYYGEGLKVIDSDKSTSKNNVLGEFLGIKKNDLNGFRSFFEKYGFLFTIDDDKLYHSIQIEDVYNLQERLTAFVHLLNNQDHDSHANINIKDLLNATIFLIFTSKSALHLDNVCIFETPTNTFFEQIKGISIHQEIDYNITYEEINGQTQEYFYIMDSLSEDSIYKISKDNFVSLISNEAFLPLINKKIIRGFKNKNQLFTNKQEQEIIDFLFHFIVEISAFDLSDIKLEDTFEEEVYSDLENNNILKNALLKISKTILAREFEINLKHVSPSYNVSEMKPDWSLPSLYSAMYFSLFYLNARDFGLKKCENINCNEFFQVSKTNGIKKYCSILCNNAVSQRNYRKRNRDS